MHMSYGVMMHLRPILLEATPTHSAPTRMSCWFNIKWVPWHCTCSSFFISASARQVWHVVRGQSHCHTPLTAFIRFLVSRDVRFYYSSSIIDISRYVSTNLLWLDHGSCTSSIPSCLQIWCVRQSPSSHRLGCPHIEFEREYFGLSHLVLLYWWRIYEGAWGSGWSLSSSLG